MPDRVRNALRQECSDLMILTAPLKFFVKRLLQLKD